MTHPDAHAQGAADSVETTQAKRCPRCNSPDPRWHPAAQLEGEVSICSHPWHAPTTERQLQGEAATLEQTVARAICCPSGCSFEGDSEDGSKCYCDTSDYHGSGIEKKAKAVVAALRSPAGSGPNIPCPRCHYSEGPQGAERYWEARWRDADMELTQLHAQVEQQAWRDISTAPKDGSVILCYWGPQMPGGARTIDLACWADGDWTDADDAGVRFGEPTLWQPVHWPPLTSTEQPNEAR